MTEKSSNDSFWEHGGEIEGVFVCVRVYMRERREESSNDSFWSMLEER